MLSSGGAAARTAVTRRSARRRGGATRASVAPASNVGDVPGDGCRARSRAASGAGPSPGPGPGLGAWPSATRGTGPHWVVCPCAGRAPTPASSGAACSPRRRAWERSLLRPPSPARSTALGSTDRSRASTPRPPTGCRHRVPLSPASRPGRKPRDRGLPAMGDPGSSSSLRAPGPARLRRPRRVCGCWAACTYPARRAPANQSVRPLPTAIVSVTGVAGA
ncbi:hypothetical protein F4556_006764 [Kitasatospora gansuensis]|uniref:Uncharacterized protein n=1 Tax=Kitasatospora gansuensis TaxID=258050 RepID=A0A7W7SIQ9_9ACTN|nr:hypothetical protein [Kitasatospora gansuensis]